MTRAGAIALAREVIAKYGSDADKPSVHLAKALLAEPQISDELFEEGRWYSCTGCHETEDGHPVGGPYPYSELFRCHLGSGCHECGGLGAVWETFPDACTTCGGIHVDVDCFGERIQ